MCTVLALRQLQLAVGRDTRLGLSVPQLPDHALMPCHARAARACSVRTHAASPSHHQRAVQTGAVALAPTAVVASSAAQLPAVSQELPGSVLVAAPTAPASSSHNGNGASSRASDAATDDSSSECCCSCGELGWEDGFDARFTLGPEIGRGSFGVVHIAVDNETGKQFAVKILHKCPGGSSGPSSCSGGSGATSGTSSSASGGGRPPSVASSSSLPETCSTDAPPRGQHLESIERELAAWTAAQGSRYVVRHEGHYEDASSAYLVQELVGGGTLKALLDRSGGKLAEGQAAAVMRGVLDVLFEVHRQDLCYGDVKPANFLVTPAPEAEGGLSVRAVDFGCSRRLPLTKPCGSPLYMAPEMAHRRFGTAVDVWAAGVMLHQLLTGKLPFWQNMSLKQVASLPPYAIVAAVRTHDVSYPRATWAAVSAEAQQLVAAMLQRDPAQRITAAEALAHPWFRRMLGHEPRPSGGERGRQQEGGGGDEPEEKNVAEFTARIAAMHL